jgi:hypothetical protein
MTFCSEICPDTYRAAPAFLSVNLLHATHALHSGELKSSEKVIHPFLTKKAE